MRVLKCHNCGPRIALVNLRFQVVPGMLIEKLAEGVVRVQTPISALCNAIILAAVIFGVGVPAF